MLDMLFGKGGKSDEASKEDQVIHKGPKKTKNGNELVFYEEIKYKRNE